MVIRPVIPYVVVLYIFIWLSYTIHTYLHMVFVSLQVALADIRNNPSAVDVTPDLVNIIMQIVNLLMCFFVIT